MEKNVMHTKARAFVKKVQRAVFGMAVFFIVGSAGAWSACGLLVVQAHSGRTDSQGGHHDYKNKSGLGNYHYHHGYSAHLHPNGICPYNSSRSSAKAASDSAAAPKTVLKAEDYKLVFDASYYYNTYLDLQSAVGNEEQKLLEHFVSYGMAEGRKGCDSFDVKIYKENNMDLTAEYGDNLIKYYEHFMNCGHQENRVHNK